jgi:quercetin dioxygenase-like cupin family protein
MSDLSSGVSVSRGEDRARLLWTGGTIFDVVLDGAQTQGTVSLLDQWGVRGDVTPMHVHRNEAEIFYVLDGSIHAWAADGEVTLGAGGAIYLPPGGVHAFGIVSDTARILTVTSPAGFADFVRAAGVPFCGDAPATWEFDLGRIMQAAPDHGLEIVGPPPALPDVPA